MNRSFVELFADGLPAVTPVVAGSSLRGEIVTGFSLVVYEGGSVEELEACARGMGGTALPTLWTMGSSSLTSSGRRTS